MPTLVQLEHRLAQASYEHERLRTGSIQRAKRELGLLREGLHALTQDKLHVTRDRIERAMEGLEQELDRLRAPGGGHG